MKKFQSILSMLLAVAIIAAMFIVPVNADVTDSNTLTGINGHATYQFTGENADRSGYAEGTITFDSVVNKQYNIFWADESGTLAGFEKIADKLTATSTTTTFSFGRNVAIPKGATGIAIYDTNIITQLNKAYDVIEIPISKQLTAENEMTFASVSDIHVNYDSEGQNATGKWKNALNYFAELGLEYVIISGDMSSNATTSEMSTYKSTIEASNYDANRIYEARGNHESQNNANFIAYTSGGEAAGEIRPYKDSPYYYVLFEGDEGEKDNLFIFMAQELSSTGNSSNQDNWSSAQIDWVEGLLKQYSGTNTNIFLVQHTVFKGWGAGDSKVGAYSQPTYLTSNYPQNFRLKHLLQEYKEVIQMSGHTHISLYEDVNFSDEEGTAARMIHNPSTSQPRWFNSSGGLDYYLATETYGSEGYVVNVTADDIVYYGRNFSTGQFIPDACFIMESYSEDRDVSKIEVTAQPEKTQYEAGETFDATGMEVTAYYDDGSSEVVKGYYVDTDTALKNSDKSVTVRFGDATTTVPVTVGAVAGPFEGSGTAEDPYLIQTAADFNKLTQLMNAAVGASSHDTEAFGAGLYYKQTADIDMTGYAGYVGTPATGDYKYGFAGVYDGAGHTLTVNITSNSFETSVFPYLNGLLMNLNVAGSITSTSSDGESSVQFVRTVGRGGAVVNCSSSLNLTSKEARGLTLTMYGYTGNYVYDGVMNCTGADIFPVTGNTNNEGTLNNVYYFAKNASGAAITGTYGTAGTTDDAVVALLNDEATLTASVAKIKTYNSAYTAATLGKWEVVDGVARVAVMGTEEEVKGDFEGKGTAEDPYLIQTAADFNKFTQFMNAAVGSGSHDTTTYGAGLYFKQTADIDMTGYAGYVGTPATGDYKYGFAGVYDGAGHTLTVNITSNSFETSVFPYLNGLLMNLNVAGSITSTSSDGESSVQFVRTVGRGGSVVNCSSSLNLTSKEARGLTLTMYGYTGNYVYDGVLNCTGADIFPVTGNTNNEGTLNNVYYFAKNASGAAITGTYGTAGTTDDAVVALLNDEATLAASVAKIKTYNSSYTAATLGKWEVVDGVARVAVMGTEEEVKGDFEGKGTAEDPYLIQTAADFNKFTQFMNAAVGSGSHDTTTYGAGLYFKQTADIDMTGYAGYVGTPATGDAKHGFAGVYDGAGHTLTVNITSNSFETSVFPYLNGLLMNLNVAGSITSTSSDGESSVQFVRTIGRGGALINCSSSLNLKSKEARGLTLTMYGYTDRFVYNGTMDCTAADVFPVTGNHSEGTMTNAYYLAKSASGAAITHTNGTQYDDKTVLATALNSGVNAATIAKIESYGIDYTDDTLVSWSNVGDMPRADGKEMQVQNPEFKVEKEEYEVNDTITFTALLPTSVTKVALANENGKYIASSASYVASDADGFNAWTITASVGTRGDRTISLLTADESGELVDSGLTASFKVVLVTAASDDALEVLGVRAPEIVNKNEVFTVLVRTSTSATNVGIVNESGNFMGKQSQSYVDKDGVREWTITMKVGSKGSRTFAVSCSDNVGNWIPLEDAVVITMGIK